jgi:hypothetical protein
MENPIKNKITAIDLIHDEDERSKFRLLTTELSEGLDNETKETLFSVSTETESGIKLVKYSTLIWKTSWKDTPVLGIRLKPIRRESMTSGDMGQSKEFFQTGLNMMEHSLKNILSSMSGHNRIMQKHLENNQFQNLDNDCVKIKEEIDHLSKFYVQMNNIIKIASLKQSNKYQKSNFNLKLMVANICEHVSSHCTKSNNTL